MILFKIRGVRKLIFAGILSVMLLISTVAFSGECVIRADADQISGKADNVPLGQVMDLLVEKTGYTVFMDKRLDQEPATFFIPAGMTPDQAIRKIVKPHSYAITFVKSGKSCRVRDIRVYPKEADPVRAEYRTYSREKLSDAKTAAASSAIVSSSSKPAGRPILRKDWVKTRPALKKDAFGAPMRKVGPLDRGPDFRPTVYQMRNAHRRFVADKKKHETKTRQAQRKQVRRDLKKQRETQNFRKKPFINIFEQEVKSNE